MDYKKLYNEMVQKAILHKKRKARKKVLEVKVREIKKRNILDKIEDKIPSTFFKGG